MFKRVADVSLTALTSHIRDDGELVVLEHGKDMPFWAARMFMVRAPDGALRGNHAHKLCSQLFVCPHGSIEVECDDGEQKIHFRLDRPNLALLVPPTIWAAEIYRGPDSVLIVLCDRVFEKDDYMRDYSHFLAWRKELKQ